MVRRDGDGRKEKAEKKMGEESMKETAPMSGRLWWTGGRVEQDRKTRVGAQRRRGRRHR
jgi:hypothetical protein